MTMQEVIDWEQQFDVCEYCGSDFVARDITGASSCVDWIQLDSPYGDKSDEFVDFCCNTCKNDFKEVYLEGSGYEIIDESKM